MANAVLVTGTDTDVGKTYVACRLIRRLKSDGRRVTAYKPVASGAVDGRWGDVDALSESSGHDDVCSQTFEAALAPPDAARAEGKSVDPALMDAGLRTAAASCDWLVVEGVGGLLCPLSDEETVADWATRHRLPLIVVVGLKLGAINHALLTAAAAEEKSLPAAFVLNERIPIDPNVRESTVRTLAAHLGDRIVARVRPDGCLLRFDPDRPTMMDAAAASSDALSACFQSFP